MIDTVTVKLVRHDNGNRTYRVSVRDQDGTEGMTGHWKTVRQALIEGIRMAEMIESGSKPNPTPGRVVRG